MTSIPASVQEQQLRRSIPPSKRSRVRLVALDYDGTLTLGGRPDPRVLAAVRAVRERGIFVVLVTGRILRELRGEWPAVDEWFDGIVAENGCVLARGGTAKPIAPEVAGSLAGLLAQRGVYARHGEVLSALRRADGPAALGAIAASGLDCQLVYNRDELMILPAGVSKGTGLRVLLDELGVSRHDAVGVGDAENDHALLEVCGLGVAVENAVPALKARADRVLTDPSPSGLVALLSSLARGEPVAPGTGRYWLRLGVTPEGEPFSLPAAGYDLVVVGGTGAGKSYFAGLLAERWLAHDYSICVLDPEGDYGSLGELPCVLVVGGEEELPSAERLVKLLHHRGGSVVVDLSLLPREDREAYMVAALRRLYAERLATGVPHWIIVDEAHGVFHAKHRELLGRDGGTCLVTYQPWGLASEILDASDLVVFLRGSFDDGPPSFPDALGLPDELRQALVAEVRALGRGEAVVLFGGATPGFTKIVLPRRAVGHVRHWHKYLHGYLPPRQHFFFRDGRGPTGRAAANLDDFFRELRRAPADVLRHHLGGGDFSRWLREVTRDIPLANAVAELEAHAVGANVWPHTEALRASLLALFDDVDGGPLSRRSEELGPAALPATPDQTDPPGDAR